MGVGVKTNEKYLQDRPNFKTKPKEEVTPAVPRKIDFDGVEDVVHEEKKSQVPQQSDSSAAFWPKPRTTAQTIRASALETPAPTELTIHRKEILELAEKQEETRIITEEEKLLEQELESQPPLMKAFIKDYLATKGQVFEIKKIALQSVKEIQALWGEVEYLNRWVANNDFEHSGVTIVVRPFPASWDRGKRERWGDANMHELKTRAQLRHMPTFHAIRPYHIKMLDFAEVQCHDMKDAEAAIAFIYKTFGEKQSF